MNAHAQQDAREHAAQAKVPLSAGRVLAKLVWVGALIGAIIGASIGVGGVAVANGAPQEASAAAIGCLVVIASYAFARAVDELTR